MPRAPKRCAKPDCQQKAPCPKHRTWQKSSGQVELPSNWKSIRKQAEGFDEKRCYMCGRISKRGAVDHRVSRAEGGSDHPSNLAWVCDGPGSCHEKKTRGESARGVQRRRNSQN